MRNLKHIIASAIGISAIFTAYSADNQLISSTADNLWQSCPEAMNVENFNPEVPYDVMISEFTAQTMQGFGGCFNELGAIALEKLDKRTRAEVLDALFRPEFGASFTVCRTPVGANDFAASWYSYDEHPGDLDLKHFSIKRDKKHLIPYIKNALAVNPDLKIWASPWSAPTWMKTNGHYANKSAEINGLLPENEAPTGTDQMILHPDYLNCYARYLSRYVADYQKEGINIFMLQFQNEPYTFNIWPNCSWTPGAITDFIGNYLGPHFAQNHPDTQLWLGTLNTDRLDHVERMLNDPDASRYIKGAGFQWEGKDIVGKIHQAHPSLPIIQTENECGDGSNDWAAAEHTFDLMKKYIGDGASLYMYFNMVLADECKSTWEWKQNAMVVVDTKKRTATFTPEFYAMKHFSRHIIPGAKRLVTMGNDQNLLAFVNPDGSRVVVVCNHDDSDRNISIALSQSKVINLSMKPKSFNTLILND